MGGGATGGNCRDETGAPATSQSASQPEAKSLTAWLPKNCHSMAHKMELSASPVALRKPTGHTSGCSCCQSRVAVLLGVGGEKLAAAGGRGRGGQDGMSLIQPGSSEHGGG